MSSADADPADLTADDQFMLGSIDLAIAVDTTALPVSPGPTPLPPPPPTSGPVTPIAFPDGS